VKQGNVKQALVNAGNKPLRLLAVGRILGAESLIQGYFLDVNSVQKGSGYGRNDRNARNPIPLVNSQAEKGKQ
jgi:hypothetical protein